MPGAGDQGFSAVVARTSTAHTPTEPRASDCAEVTVIRSGAAILFGEFGHRYLNVGDVILPAPRTLRGVEPEGRITATTLYLDRDFVADQVFWQYAPAFTDRFDARHFVDPHFADPASSRKATGTVWPRLTVLRGLARGPCACPGWGGRGLVTRMAAFSPPLRIRGTWRTDGGRTGGRARRSACCPAPLPGQCGWWRSRRSCDFGVGLSPHLDREKRRALGELCEALGWPSAGAWQGPGLPPQGGGSGNGPVLTGSVRSGGAPDRYRRHSGTAPGHDVLLRHRPAPMTSSVRPTCGPMDAGWMTAR